MDDKNFPPDPLVDFETGETVWPESRVEAWFKAHPEVNRKDITEAYMKDAAWEEELQRQWEETMGKKRREQMKKQSESRYSGFGADRGF
jgi:hypothetical protein